jgi:hypothetical protein
MSEFSVDTHIDSKEPVVREIYDALTNAIRKIGKSEAEPKKTCIHLVNRTGFAGVYPRKDYINLEFKLAREINSPRIAKVERVSANRHHHTVRLSSAADVDKELSGWLREAYVLSA